MRGGQRPAGRDAARRAATGPARRTPRPPRRCATQAGQPSSPQPTSSGIAYAVPALWRSTNTSDPTMTWRPERRRQAFGRLARRVAREGPREVPPVDGGRAQARDVGRLVGDRHEAQPAAHRHAGEPLRERQAGDHALELVAVDAADDRQRSARPRQPPNSIDRESVVLVATAAGSGDVRVWPAMERTRRGLRLDQSMSTVDNLARRAPAASATREDGMTVATGAAEWTRRGAPAARLGREGPGVDAVRRRPCRCRACSTPGSSRASTRMPGSCGSTRPPRSRARASSPS